MEMGHKLNPLDHCVYSWKCQDNFCMLSLYVDANFFILDLGQNCNYYTINTFGQGQEPHAPMINGGALAEEPPMPKFEFREKVYENFSKSIWK